MKKILIICIAVLSLTGQAKADVIPNFFIQQTLIFFGKVANAVAPIANQVNALLTNGAENTKFAFENKQGTEKPVFEIEPTANLSRRRVNYTIKLKIEDETLYHRFQIRLPASPSTIDRVFQAEAEKIWDKHFNGSPLYAGTQTPNKAEQFLINLSNIVVPSAHAREKVRVDSNLISLLIHYGAIIYYNKQLKRSSADTYRDLIDIHIPIIQDKLFAVDPSLKRD